MGNKDGGRNKKAAMLAAVASATAETARDMMIYMRGHIISNSVAGTSCKAESHEASLMGGTSCKMRGLAALGARATHRVYVQCLYTCMSQGTLRVGWCHCGVLQFCKAQGGSCT